jgi:lauroyl/myristoyl acyltransferase
LNDKGHDLQDSAIETAQELKAAYDALRAGGRAHILPDGYIGQRAVKMSWYGHTRGFQPTFAHLALRTGASIVPMDAWMSDDGLLHIEADSPFEITAEGFDERVNGLIKLYAAWLKRRWKEYPSSVALPEMAKFMKLPLADVKDEG